MKTIKKPKSERIRSGKPAKSQRKTATARKNPERRQRDFAMQESEKGFRKFFEQGSIGLALVSKDLRILGVNQALSRMLQYTLEELTGAGIADFCVPEDGPLLMEHLRRLLRIDSSNYRKGHRYLRKDGGVLRVNLTASAILDADGIPCQVLCVFEDFTVLMLALDELQRDEALLAEAQRIARLGSWERDLITNTIRWSDEFYRIIGIEPHSVPASLEAFLRHVDPNDLQRVRQKVEEAQRKGISNSIDFQIFLSDGTKRMIHSRTEVQRDSLGSAVLLRGTIQDITDQKKIEQQLQQSQKIEAIGLLAGGIAHDFNNLLTVILGRCELLLRGLARPGPHRKEALEIQKAAEQAQRLTSQLLAFGRKQVLNPKVLSLNAEIERMTQMVRSLIGNDIEVVLELESELGRVKADPGQIEQVVLNLAINARDAMPRGGRLTIQTANSRLDESSGTGRENIKPGRYVALSVDDTGSGMNREILARVFEPFFTTKPPSQGTGLGLATVYGIVKQSNGYIWAYSEPGMGSTFRIYLPQVEEEVEVSPAAPSPQVPRGTIETVLLVEDDPAVREVARAFLELAGYAVLEAIDTADAVQICKNHSSTIHLLITDVVMPQMNGPELARHLTALRPKMKVVYVSGYSGSMLLQQGGLAKGAHFLQKPYTFETITRKVREVLDA